MEEEAEIEGKKERREENAARTSERGGTRESPFDPNLFMEPHVAKIKESQQTAKKEIRFFLATNVSPKSLPPAFIFDPDQYYCFPVFMACSTYTTSSRAANVVFFPWQLGGPLQASDI